MADLISDKSVKELQPPTDGRPYLIVYDADPDGARKLRAVKGFGIRVTKAGAKSFVLNYRNQDGTERRLTIGTYGPNEWSVEAARKRAGELKKAISRGEDPLAAKVEARTAPTMADLCDRYEEDHLPRKRASSQADDKAMIAKIIRPKLGSTKVAAVTHSEIDRLHRGMKDTPYRANRCLALLSKMFNLANKWGWRPDNPCRGVERFPEQKRTRYLKPEEIARLTAALADYPEARAAKVDGKARERERLAGRKAADAIRLCLLTGCRRGEALSARWDQLDLDGGIWKKPGSTTKQKTEHEAPLSDAAIALLSGIREAAAKDDDGEPKSPWVFPGRWESEHVRELNDEWAALRKAAKLNGVRLHDLRHTFASLLVSGGASLPLIGALLGHSNPTTTHRYAHLYRDPLKQAADTVGAIVTGKAGADVRNLRERAS